VRRNQFLDTADITSGIHATIFVASVWHCESLGKPGPPLHSHDKGLGHDCPLTSNI
jgi:hypothetical protein